MVQSAALWSRIVPVDSDDLGEVEISLVAVGVHSHCLILPPKPNLHLIFQTSLTLTPPWPSA